MTRRISIVLGAAMALALTGTAVAGVVKTKTKSNQSNDRIAHNELAVALEAAFDQLDTNLDGQLDDAEQAALIKPKTKSNQSNDRCSAECPTGQGGEPAMLGAPLKGVDVKLGRAASARLLHVTFSADLDRDGNGRVSKGEWMDDWQAQFVRADGDHDGSLSEAEAVKFGWNVKSSETR